MKYTCSMETVQQNGRFTLFFQLIPLYIFYSLWSYLSAIYIYVYFYLLFIYISNIYHFYNISIFMYICIYVFIFLSNIYHIYHISIFIIFLSMYLSTSQTSIISIIHLYLCIFISFYLSISQTSIIYLYLCIFLSF